MTLHERFSCCVFFVAKKHPMQQVRNEYKIMLSKTNLSKLHIVLCAPKKTGKTTLIERIIKEAGSPAAGSPMPIYGFQTKRFAGPDGIGRIYMFPAGRGQTDEIPPDARCAGGTPAGAADRAGDRATAEASDARYIGSTQGRVMDVCTEAFDTFGTVLIQSARPGGLLIMDEIGHMEKDAHRFLQAIFEALGGDIPILASVRYTAGSIGYLERIKRHPRVRLYMLTEENRDAVYIEVRNAIFSGNAGRKEEKRS